MKLLIGIPAYNEEQTVGKVIGSIPDKIPGLSEIRILVVDDGSTDRTAKVAGQNRTTVVRHLLNRGLGAVLKTIFEYARLNSFDILVTMDADGQHSSKDLVNMLSPVIKKISDVSIGTRWIKKSNAPKSRVVINHLANLLTFIFFGIKTTDSQSGFRCFNKKSISLIHLQSDGMEISSEIFREISQKGLIFKEVPIRAIYTDYSKSKGQQLENAPNVFIQLLLRLLR